MRICVSLRDGMGIRVDSATVVDRVKMEDVFQAL